MMNPQCKFQGDQAMGSPHHVFSPKELTSLGKGEVKKVGAEISQHVKNDPMLKEIVKVHRSMRNHLKQKLAPLYNKLKGKK
jgi:hypothetical protein